MSAALRALLTGIIDYAGLFPPAKLSLEESIRNYARYRTEPESWMLGRFICPASRLHDLLRFHDELFAHGSPHQFSALGRGGETFADFVPGLGRDMAEINDFRRAHAGQAVVDIFETKLPEEVIQATSTESLDTLVGLCSGFLGSPAGRACFLESNPMAECRGALLVIERLQRVCRAAPRDAMGYKVRCGGLQAGAFPSAEQLATILAQCVMFKCTAGLHHPIRRWDPDLKTHMHGFINVFTAGVLTEKHGLVADRILPILEDDDVRNFVFSDDGIRWKDLAISTDEIAVARRVRMTSFGSCSFDEPRDDLRKLGWLS